MHLNSQLFFPPIVSKLEKPKVKHFDSALHLAQGDKTVIQARDESNFPCNQFLWRLLSYSHSHSPWGYSTYIFIHRSLLMKIIRKSLNNQDYPHWKESVIDCDYTMTVSNHRIKQAMISLQYYFWYQLSNKEMSVTQGFSMFGGTG